MKTPLLLLLFLTLLPAHSQTTLYALNGNLSNSGLAVDGYNCRSYTMFTPETVFDQSSAGFDKIWDISNFTELTGGKYYSNADPSPSELLEYPGTGMVTVGTISTSQSIIVDSKAYATGSLFGLTGYSNTQLTLKYSTDNMDFGNFPMFYGDLHLDNTIAGTYVFGAYSGTFAGTFITEVDAYGTMITATDGTVDVTRLKTIETLQINYPGFGNVGTYIQTTYRYYREMDLWPYVKSTNTVIDIDILGLNTNTTNIEKAPAALLSARNLESDNGISVFPNPAKNELNIKTAPNQEVVSVTVIDLVGKIVLTENETTRLDIGSLQDGTYLVKIETNEGSIVKKIIKN